MRNREKIIKEIKFLALLLALLLAFAMITSCDNAKQATKHYKKFIKYGGKFNCDNDTLWKYDTTFVDGKVKIDSFPIPCNCPEVELPKTRWEIRHMAKRERDSMKHVEEMLQLEIKRLKGIKQIKQVEKKIVQSETKGKKHDSKGERSRLVWAIVFGLVALIVLVLIINRVKRLW
jgi:uncharacterized integral membrane protein